MRLALKAIDKEVMIQFNLNAEKAVESVIYLASKKPGMTQYFFAKMFFYAEKHHLNNYGQPIFGDRFIKMKNGPVPSFILDLLHKNGQRLTHDIFLLIEDSLNFTISGNHIKTTPKREPDFSCFSKSDIESLDAAFEKCKNMTVQQLIDETHKDPAWAEATENCVMDYSLFLDKNNPDRNDIIASLSEWPETLVM